MRIDYGRLSTGSGRQLVMVHMVVVNVRMRQIAQFIPENTRNGTHARYIRLIADTFAEQSIADLPRENARILLFQLSNVVHHFRGCHARLRPSDGAGQYGPGLVVPGEYLGHAAMTDAQLAGNITGTNAEAGEFDDLHACLVGQRTAVDKETAELIDFAVLLRLCFCKRRKEE